MQQRLPMDSDKQRTTVVCVLYTALYLLPAFLCIGALQKYLY